MFHEKLKQNNEVRARYEAITDDLVAKRSELEAKLAQAKKAYDRALVDDIEQGTKRTQAEVSKLLRAVEEYEHQLADTENRIEVTKEVMKERLKELLPELKEARDLAIQEAKDLIKGSEAKAWELKAQYILFARDLNKPYRKAHEVNSLFLDAAHAVNIKDYDRDFPNLPALNLVGTYDGPHTSLMPTLTEVSEAYTLGIIPSFVLLYNETGELLPDNLARKRIEQLRRESGQNE